MFRRVSIKIAALLFLVLFIQDILLGMLFTWTGATIIRASNQLILWPVAKSIAEQISPLVADTIDYDQLERIMRLLRSVNPATDIFLLDEKGQVLVSFTELKLPAHAKIDLGSIRKFLSYTEADSLPITSEVPTGKRQALFSVANITIGGKPGYVYVTTAEGRDFDVSGYVMSRYFTLSSLLFLVVAILVSTAVGVALFILVTRRLDTVGAVMQKFRAGDYSQRLSLASRDEVGELAGTYNEVAETIQLLIAKLESTDRIRRDFVTGLAHDLRLPLTSIHGYLDEMRLLSPEARQTQLDETLDVLQRNSSTLNGLVDHLFEYSQLEAREISPTFTDISITKIADDVVRKRQPIANRAQIKLDLDCGREIVCRGNAQFLERAMSNLVENALRYTLPGGSVRVSVQQKRDQCLVSVSDTGVGIAKDEIPYIFQRFYRVDDARTRHIGGTGLGLAIVKRIVELHGSAISVHSRPEEGTTFSFALAVNSAAAETAFP